MLFGVLREMGIEEFGLGVEVFWIKDFCVVGELGGGRVVIVY